MKGGEEEGNDDIELNMKLVWDFATTTPIDELSFILQTKEYNLKAARESRKGNYGHCLGKTMDRPLSHGIFGNSIFSHIISATASACDARMGGALIPVMSNSGSGNQGICATNPVAVYAEENENTEEEPSISSKVLASSVPFVGAWWPASAAVVASPISWAAIIRTCVMR